MTVASLRPLAHRALKALLFKGGPGTYVTGKWTRFLTCLLWYHLLSLFNMLQLVDTVAFERVVKLDVRGADAVSFHAVQSRAYKSFRAGIRRPFFLPY